MLNHVNSTFQAKFDGSCSKQEKATFTHKKVGYIYTVYEICETCGQILWVQILRWEILCLELLNWLKILILVHINILAMVLEFFPYQLLLGLVKMLQHLLLIWVHQYILIIKRKILGNDPTNVLNYTMLTPEKEYLINFTEQQKNVCLSLHCNGVNIC